MCIYVYTYICEPLNAKTVSHNSSYVIHTCPEVSQKAPSMRRLRKLGMPGAPSHVPTMSPARCKNGRPVMSTPTCQSRSRTSARGQCLYGSSHQDLDRTCRDATMTQSASCKLATPNTCKHTLESSYEAMRWGSSTPKHGHTRPAKPDNMHVSCFLG